MPDPDLEILYEDPSCLAVLKPAGLSTQSPAGIDSLEDRARDWLRSRAIEAGAAAEEAYLGLPHRLDRPVSGVILFAKTRRAARIISRQFERRLVRKIYWACLEGTVEPAEGTWTDFIRKVPGEPRAEVVAAGDPNAQQAVLHYRTIKAGSLEFARRGSCLEIELETGRMHQVRIQAASRRHPLAGDAQYSAATSFGPQTADPRERAIALHARSLTFRHPETNESLTVTAPLPAAWAQLGLPAS
ncbi:MAG TPA: RluA family pseudouridine synthase [Pirellulales bacterium]|jgi:RluA family pseudouridine synthase|nr:RluA family pseudouridine synthase [Pirellulales bacterium]